MSIVADLIEKPGVVAAGEYAYRGDRFSYKGALTEKFACMASIMCRATTMSANMESAMIASFRPNSGLQPVHGWILRGPDYTLCAVANVFCLLANDQGSVNQVFGFMRQALAHETMELI